MANGASSGFMGALGGGGAGIGIAAGLGATGIGLPIALGVGALAGGLFGAFGGGGGAPKVDISGELARLDSLFQRERANIEAASTRLFGLQQQQLRQRQVGAGIFRAPVAEAGIGRLAAGQQTALQQALGASFGRQARTRAGLLSQLLGIRTGQESAEAQRRAAVQSQMIGLGVSGLISAAQSGAFQGLFGGGATPTTATPQLSTLPPTNLGLQAPAIAGAGAFQPAGAPLTTPFQRATFPGGFAPATVAPQMAAAPQVSPGTAIGGQQPFTGPPGGLVLPMSQLAQLIRASSGR